MSNGCRRIHGTDRAVARATWLIALAIIGHLAAVVATRRGNLAWDDADYLRRALANARVCSSATGLWILPRALDCLLHEHPKPPWLVAWIQAGVLIFDRHRLDELIVHASVVPFAFLLVAVILLGRRLEGAWGGMAALVCLGSSPASLSFGAKVMVETFLSLWVLLTYALTCQLLTQPSRRRGVALGMFVGLAFLTKLTTVLFLPAPLLFAVVRVIRGGPDRRILIRSLVWSTVICAAVAGPWYALNASRAVQFARFSSRYNEIVEGRVGRDQGHERLVMMARDLAGWPLAATLACGTLFFTLSAVRRRASGESCQSDAGTDLSIQFSRMASLGAFTAAAILLYPTYFDTRFLLPIWPVLAVDMGRRFAVMLRRFQPMPRIIVCGGLAAGVIAAALMVARQPTITTYWKTAELIDGLVQEYRISNLGNVGNCAEWNVCKTGLINELRDQPASCFVLHDLTRSPVNLARQRLTRFDAVVVLGRDHLPASALEWAPGLNRSYGPIALALAEDSKFIRVAPPQTEGLPPLAVYVRRRYWDRAQQASRPSTAARRL